MKDFLKNVLATVVGIIISSVVLFFLVGIIILGLMRVAITGSDSGKVTLKDNSVLSINLSGIMKDRVTETPLNYLGLSQTGEIGLTDILSAIKIAKTEEKIKGIYIHSGLLSASSASLSEIRQALEDFKTSGKFVIAYGDDYMQSGYYLSSVADKVILNPQGTLDLHGLSVNRSFYKNLFDKLGVEMQIFKVGTYKSAVEPYFMTEMSDANKEQTASFANDIWSNIIMKIATSRSVTVAEINELADSFTALQGADIMLEKGLVDTLLYETEVQKYLKLRVGIEESDKLNTISVKDIKKGSYDTSDNPNDQVAILYAEGSIVSGSSIGDINDRYLIKEIEKLKNNDKVKAVVFRVNSPGGSAYASEQIWKAISDLKDKKPIIVSMGDYAASGGYYISCNANKIFAEPNTLTGSIGIFGMFPNVEGLAQKVGLTFDGVKTNKLADFGDITRPMREEEKTLVQNYVNRGYELFLSRCSEGRDIPRDSLDKIAQGRVWTGNQALRLGLIDALGTMSDAITEAAKMVKLDNYSVMEYPKPENPLETLFRMGKEDITASWLKQFFGTDYSLFKTYQEMKNTSIQDFMQARIPYEIVIR